MAFQPHQSDAPQNWPGRALLLALTLALVVPSGSGADLPEKFTERLVAGGFTWPVAMEFDPDGRLFVCEKRGKLWIIENGAVLPGPCLTVTVDQNGERGLLGVTFDPAFENNSYIYVYYTSPTPQPHNRVSRFVADGDHVVPGSELVLLELESLTPSVYHNAGSLRFGPDGKLYVATGDNQIPHSAGSLTNRRGKLLRINSDGTIPEDNPFYTQAEGPNRAIYALGFRNPFSFAVHLATGRFYVNDVGKAHWEEINAILPGGHYAWPMCEGNCPTPDPASQDPLYAYPHTEGKAIVGAAFYDPPVNRFPASYRGAYFFADFVAGWIRVLDMGSSNVVREFASNVTTPVDVDVGPDGQLYYLTMRAGDVMTIFPTNDTPQITLQPADQTVEEGETAEFRVQASGAPPLGYQWLQSGDPVQGANASSYSFIATLADDGSAYSCKVTNLHGTAISSPAILRITTNRRPVGTITAPRDPAFYQAGDTVEFAGTAVDPEDGVLPPEAFSWTIRFHHDTHTHPHLGPIAGVTNGTFFIPESGETSPNVWYRVSLNVTDSAGRQRESFVDVLPRTSTMDFETSPPGLQMTLDGEPTATPFSVLGVVGIQRTLGIVSPQQVAGTTFFFSSWSDGGGPLHVISTPSEDTTFTAQFTEAAPRLTMARSGDAIILSWPSSVLESTVQSTSNLFLGVQWEPVDLPVMTSNGVHSMTITAAEDRVFFRLLMESR